MIAVCDHTEPRRGLCEYSRYIRLQKSLRRRRRELLLFCGHPPTITAGVQSREPNLLSAPDVLAKNGIAVHAIGRGGDHTAHEPGQCVIYPHIDLKKRELGVSKVFQDLLKITQSALEVTWGLRTEIRTDAPGLYWNGRKLGSIGIQFKSFFTSFGLAVNVSNDLSTFRHIHPCGFSDLQVTNVLQCGGDPALLSRFMDVWTEEFQDWLPAASMDLLVASGCR